jgi:hypothetical protein
MLNFQLDSEGGNTWAIGLAVGLIVLMFIGAGLGMFIFYLILLFF